MGAFLRHVCWLAGLMALTSCGPGGETRAPESSAVPSAAGLSAAGARLREPVVTASGVEMIYVPGGEFVMGTNGEGEDEGPEHRVRVDGFLMDTYEVTHELFAKAQLPNPSHWQDHPKKPVERVRWRDAKLYCNERSLLEGLQPCYDEKTPNWDCNFEANGYRLPTEAEWEYACRAGSDRPYDFGGVDKLKQYAWFEDNGDERTHPVGQKKPNGWGLHDLYGNVSEWCEDVYGPEYYKQSPAENPRGPKDPGKDSLRAMRGGSWKSSAAMCRATFRQGQKTGDTDACFYTDYCGFRCVRRVSEAELETLRKKP